MPTTVPRTVRLPRHIEPAGDEALASWIAHQRNTWAVASDAWTQRVRCRRLGGSAVVASTIRCNTLSDR